MQKKLCLAVVMIMVAFSCTVTNAVIYENNFGPFTEWDEEFTLHADVAFGDTIEEAYQKELAAGLEDVEAVDDSVLHVYGTIASIPNSSITYKIDADYTINRATYSLRSVDSVDHDPIILDSTHAAEDSITISDALRRKYGNPYFSSNGESFLPIITDSLQYDLKWSKYFLQHEIPVYETWILDVGDEKCILIDHYLIIGLNIQLETVCTHMLAYQMFDRDYVEGKILDNIESNIRAEEQLLNDL